MCTVLNVPRAPTTSHPLSHGGYVSKSIITIYTQKHSINIYQRASIRLLFFNKARYNTVRSDRCNLYVAKTPDVCLGTTTQRAFTVYMKYTITNKNSQHLRAAGKDASKTASTTIEPRGASFVEERRYSVIVIQIGLP